MILEALRKVLDFEYKDTLHPKQYVDFINSVRPNANEKYCSSCGGSIRSLHNRFSIWTFGELMKSEYRMPIKGLVGSMDTAYIAESMERAPFAVIKSRIEAIRRELGAATRRGQTSIAKLHQTNLQVLQSYIDDRITFFDKGGFLERYEASKAEPTEAPTEEKEARTIEPEKPKAEPKDSKFSDDELRDFLEQGNTKKAAAKYFGVSASYISQRSKNL